MQEEKANIGNLFNRIAPTYDKLNHLLSAGIDRRWRRKAVKMMRRNDNVLDVAIGTADLAVELLHQSKASNVVGIDLSDEMMRLGREKMERLNLQDKVAFQHVDATNMPFEDGCFDAVTCAFGVRNFADLDKGLLEMRRVLKQDGELVILEFSYPENPLIRFCYDFYFSKILPLVGKWFSKDDTAYKYLNSSVKHFIWGEEMCNHLRQAGFQNVSYKTLTFGIATIYKSVNGDQ